MTAGKSIDEVSALVASAVALTEQRFLAMGRNLEQAMSVLASLMATFGQLQVELESEELRHTVDDLSRVASQVRDIVATHGKRKGTFTRLTELTDGIAVRVARLRGVVRSVSVLAVNAKITAAGMSAAGAEFVEFSNEIARSLQLAAGNLQSLDDELAGLGSQIHAASAGTGTFERQQADAIKSIPRRLAAGVQTIATRRGEAAASSSTIAARSQQTHQRIGSAIMALQIGDTTRQRAEHVQQSLGMAAHALAPESRRGDLASGHWHAVPEEQQQALAAAICRLAAAQLTATAEEFSREAGRIRAALEGLAKDAREIRRLGDAAFGSAAGQGSFLQELDAEIGQTKQLLRGFQDARAVADHLAGSVSDGTANLAAQVVTLRSLEADIRIMALNTTLKCGRIGAQGRSLVVIANELTQFSAGTEVEAAAIAADLQHVVGVSAELGEGAAGKGVSAVNVMDTMIQAVGRLGGCERGFTAALAMLTRDGEKVAGLLDETASSISSDDEIGGRLRQAAADLAAFHQGIDGEYAADAGERILAEIWRVYSMEQEREVHARVVGRPATIAADAGPGAAPAAADAGLDAIFF